jgi:hypothetical protein
MLSSPLPEIAGDLHEEKISPDLIERSGLKCFIIFHPVASAPSDGIYIFFHPDFTVGTGVTPVRLHTAGRGLYRQWGIAPRPEDLLLNFSQRIQYSAQ